MLAFALGRLRWSPEIAWRATPREVAAAARAFANSGAPFVASDLAALMAAHPDR